MIKDLAVRFRDEFYRLERGIFGNDSGAESMVVLFTSSHPGEGVSSITLALALFMTRLHPSEQVVVVEANLRQPSLAEMLNLKSNGSLLGVLQRSTSLPDAIQKVDKYGFSVIPAGQPQITDSLVSYESDLDGIREVLASLKDEYKYILVDSPPVIPFIDATRICGETDGVILVVESERTRSEVVDYAIDKLKSAGADILGIILNKREFHIPKKVYRFL
ncbi:MAG: CpsD/CapB family tyrosine-protein kinase [Desulfomonilaceae bacterium]